MTSRRMTHKAYRNAADALGVSMARLGRALGVDARTGRRYALDETEIPPPVAKLVKLMVAGRVSIDEVEAS
jgi:transcriptional regulator with XRE-family HTH domain